ncbi:acid phosphatase [Arachidicoccus soli]|uniref:Acid phosphatase n=2 Tax=Arachidicoccus soli TaxID=2341117 RepID=A0A386HTF6_9BACT|nr:acid phosphatase [Arachidicoccus soli]
MNNIMRKLNLILFAMGIILGLFSCKQKGKLVPRPNHVVVIIYENHKYSQILNSRYAPFITSLMKDAAVFTNSHGVIHPSQPNYLAFYAGSVQNITDDKCLDSVTPFTTKNLGASLIQKGFTFKGYAQGLPEIGSKICKDSLSAITGGTVYGRKHCPWINWQGDKENNIPDSLSLPMTYFPRDFDQLPTVSFVIPDMDNDMHNIGRPGDSAAIARGDNWLKDNMSNYIDWAKKHNSLLIFTFDEDDFTAENRIPTLFIGEQVKPGKYNERIDHFDVLRTIEKMYDLPNSAQDTSAHAITDVWK